MKQFFFSFVFAIAALSTFSQDNRSHTDTTKTDSLKKANPPRAGIKSYESVITKSYKTQKGLFAVHQLKDTVYFEIPDSILHQDIMVISRLVRGPGGYGVYPGEELNEKTIQFERGPDSSIRIRYDLVVSDADSTNTIYKAVVKSNLNPIVISFPIKAYSKDSTSCVIDVSK
ncbi:MAG: DUF5118 domain-containing protein, partial [Chitinophaga rupis]